MFSLVQLRLLGWVWLLLLLSGPAADAQQKQRVVCSMEVEGYYTKPGIRRALVSCSNGVISAAVGQEARSYLRLIQGVKRAPDHCGARVYNCLFRVCMGSNVHFKDLRITGLVAPEYVATLCLEGDSDILLTNATFTDNTGSFIGTSSATITLRDSTMANNKGTTDMHIAGVGALEEANVLMDNCNCANNTGETGGSCVRMMGKAGARARIVNSVFYNNTASCSKCSGGAVTSYDNAKIEIRNSTFDLNGASVGGGAVAALGNSNVTVHGCRFTHHSMAGIGSFQQSRGVRNSGPEVQEGGAILVADSAKVSLYDSILDNNSAPSRGGALAVHTNATAVLSRCTLQHNSVEGQGGAIFTNGTISLTDTWIVGNNASTGGGMALAEESLLRLGNNVSVSGNSASSRGGGVDSKHKPDEATFKALVGVTRDNTALYEPEISVPIERLELADNITVFDLTSRVAASEGLVTVNVMVMGWFRLPSRNTEVEAVFRDVVQAVNSTDDAGFASFALKLNEDPGSYDVFFRPKGQREPSVKLLVNVTGCQLGDVTADTGKACISCPANKFSMNPGNTSCDDCPDNANCPGGAQVLPKPGFWSSSPKSTQMHRCRNPDACPGDAAATCADGYESNICGVCSPGWGTSSPFTCRRCWQKGVIVTLYILAGILMLLVAKALCFFTLDFTPAALKAAAAATNKAQPPQVEEQTDAAAAVMLQAAQPGPTALLKPFTVYLQFMLLVATMQGLSWPATLSRPFQALQVLFASSSPQSLGLECILPRNGRVPVPVQIFLLTMVMPVVLMLALLVWETLRAYRVSKRRARPLQSVLKVEKERLVAQSIIVCFLLYPTMLRAVMGLFACIPLDNPVNPLGPYKALALGSFFAGDMSQQCFRGYHKTTAFALGIPLLVLLLVVLPVSMLWFMLHHRQELYSERLRSFSFMYQMYRPKVFYWEVVVLLQTAILCAISIYGFSLGTYYSCLALTAGLATTMVLHAWMRPYASMAAGRTSLRGLACVTFTSFAALSFLPVGSVYGQATVSPAYALTAGAFVLIVNFVYVVSVGVQLVRAVQWTEIVGAARRLIETLRGMLGVGQGKKGAERPAQAGKDASPV